MLLAWPRVVVCWLALAAACGAGTETPQDSSNTPVTPPPSLNGQDWTRFDVDPQRSGVFVAETGITSANVASLVRQQVPIDGTVDGSAIYLHDVQIGGAAHDAFFVTTTYGKTLAIDANDGSVLWRFTPTSYASVAGSARVTTATPVADPDRTHIYAASPDGDIQKLNVSDGSAVWSTAITTLPAREKIASSLNLFRGKVLATTGGYIGDAPPYQGHVVSVDAATGQLSSVWNSLCSNQSQLLTPSNCAQSGSAIWGRAGAVVDSATGDIFVATGNALWDGSTNWGDATLALDASAAHLVANYTPTNTASLNASDADVGSTSPALLDATHVLQGGKDGTMRVIDLQVSGGSSPHKGGEAQVVSTPSGSGLFTAPAVWRRSVGTWVFAADGGGTAAWTYNAGRLTKAWSNSHAGTSPIVAGGLLYVYDPGGTLRAYDPTTGALAAELACGRGHWNSPIAVDGRIALPEGNSNDHATAGTFDIWRKP
ncbi:MAG TPA: PQQ-binding-like beta-propeller repeat protein [Gemmatimonadaceae bacterium]|nr:PQQ-binding-like beta-propeller repeat protein [Gemmatimonadaceae bacterium]